MDTSEATAERADRYGEAMVGDGDAEACGLVGSGDAEVGGGDPDGGTGEAPGVGGGLGDAIGVGLGG